MNGTATQSGQSNSNKNMNDEEDTAISRNPKDYRPEGVHFFQTYKRRGGKANGHGVESWIITFLIKNGKIHHSKDNGRFVFKGYIKDQTGTERRWWLPVQKKKGEPNVITTCPYVKGLEDIDIKLLNPVKPSELH